jgi:iron complex outermembrane recepter protein
MRTRLLVALCLILTAATNTAPGRRLAIVLLLVVAPLASFPSATLSAQDLPAGRGQLALIVSDTTGARVADAAVVLTRGADRRTSATGSDGVARFANLTTGSWAVTITRAGFAPWRQSVLVGPGAVDLPVDLVVAGVSEAVEVAAVAGPPTSVPLGAQATGGTRLDIPVLALPASLFLLGQELIQERGARSAEEAVQLAVGMTASTGVGSIPSYSTRGWGGNNISLMRDGIRQNTNSQSSRPVDTFLLDRIEILKGPASLLYGEGAIGGAVNMVSKPPIAERTAEMLLSYGSFGSSRVGVGANVPLRRNLFARMDASRNGTDGYVQNSPQKLFAAAAGLRWLPTSNVSLRASATYTHDDTSAYYATPFINGTIDRRTRSLNYNMEDRLTKSANRWAQIEADMLLGRGWQLHNQLFASTHKLDWRNFEGYSYNDATGLVDVTSYFLIWRDDLLLGNRVDARNSVRLGGRDLKFMVGAELQRNDMERAGTPPGTSIRRSLDPFNPQPHFDPGLAYARQRDVLVGTRGVFAESLFDATARLKIVSGLRWEEIGLDYTPYPSRVTASTTYRPTTGRLGAVFEATANVNVYASYSRAVEPTTQLVGLDGSQQEFSLVPGQQVEVGAKGGAFGGRLDGTFAYFDIEKRDILVTSLIDGIRTNQQVGRQTSRGIELALLGRPTRSLTIAGDIAVTGASFDDFIEIVNDVTFSRTGNTPPNVPTIIWNVSPTQRFGRLDFTGTLRQLGPRWGDNANTRRVGSFTTVDAGVAFRLNRSARIVVRGRNLTDRLYTQFPSQTAGRLEPPRSVDVTFRTRLSGF